MKQIIYLCIAALLAGCAGGKKSNEYDAPKAVVFITVKNWLNSTAGVYWNEPGGFPRYLGRVKAGQTKKFVIDELFHHSRFELLAKPNWGKPLVARIPKKMESGKTIVWELSRKHMTWKIKDRAAN